ncbi:Uncharacterized conserved protein [Prevotella aff. ruminicola Tc2-24]|uniref:Uncharacterized conserved protein n=2 Tax=Prevotella aff. ruminicola Tc2-24 TaxID=81582 RepID=A0A1I0LXQ3_9BACT|nr:Uncharacterized conserved protein [Prevotella aff. ruminicola Tc2-24]
MNRYFYRASLNDFFNDTSDEIFGKISRNDEGDSVKEQKYAWSEELDIMRDVLTSWKGESGEVIFEFSIPRLGKRIDVVVLLRGIVFVIEFKAGQQTYLQSDMEQVMDYALDLKYFHLGSHRRTIVPILVATEAENSSHKLCDSVYNDHIYNPLLTNPDNLGRLMCEVIEREKALPSDDDEFSDWAISRYSPTPTIIEAASALYRNHTVEDIVKHEAAGNALDETTQFVLNVINYSKEHKEKSICFVTGVPGAGKTLVGLNVAVQQSIKAENDPDGERNLAVYLSGNGPLVKVLTAALAKDKQKKEHEKGNKCNITDAKREVSQFIQIIHRYRGNMLAKIKLPIMGGKLEIDETKSVAHHSAGHGEVEHVAIFDEAQRSWDLEHLAGWLARGGSRGGMKKVSGFPMSEAEFLIWSLDLRKDWAVIVCLVGGGQEINTGEAGISEWLRALNETFPHWKVYLSKHLTDKEYAEGNVADLVRNNPNVSQVDQLHLAVSMRSFRAENLSKFVHYVLDRDTEAAKELYLTFKDKYPLVITRDLCKAKRWLEGKARGSERYGLVVSSQAYRLKPLAIDVRLQPDIENWFLADKMDVRSSLFLEDAATEFDIQGLELDWTCLVWDGDFRYTSNGWDHNAFRGSKWQKIRQAEAQSYQINAYRVLMTRARQGMIICVPEGNLEDHTRLPEFYDGTYHYLKSLGIEEI